MIVREFSVTIATASMPKTVSQAMYSDGEKRSNFKVLFCRSDSLVIDVKKENDGYTNIRINLHLPINPLLNN